MALASSSSGVVPAPGSSPTMHPPFFRAAAAAADQEGGRSQDRQQQVSQFPSLSQCGFSRVRPAVLPRGQQSYEGETALQVKPPSTTSWVPVTYFASSEARKRAA